MKKIIVLLKKDNIQLSIEKGHRVRFVAENLETGIRFAPPLVRPDQWRAAIKNAKQWTPPLNKLEQK